MSTLKHDEDDDIPAWTKFDLVRGGEESTVVLDDTSSQGSARAAGADKDESPDSDFVPQE